MTIQSIRKNITIQRLNLDSIKRMNHANQVMHHVLKSPHFEEAQHIAFYMAVNGEVETKSIIQHAFNTNKSCYLPVLHPIKHNTLVFYEYTQNSTLIPNRFGILEPDKHANTIRPESLDLVIAPLVAFDSIGHRIGTGAGYYDRTFSFVKQTHPSKPILMGLAYEFQKLNKIKPEPWDVPLHTIITESTVY